MALLISIFLLLAGLVNENSATLIASSIFYLSWVIDFRLNILKVEIKENDSIKKIYKKNKEI